MIAFCDSRIRMRLEVAILLSIRLETYLATRPSVYVLVIHPLKTKKGWRANLKSSFFVRIWCEGSEGKLLDCV